MAGESHAFKLLLEQLTGRLDSHGDDIRAQSSHIQGLRDHFDFKIDKVLTLLTDCQERDCRIHESLGTRITTIETSRGTKHAAMSFIYLGAISLVSAVLGGIITRVTL